MRSMDAVRRSGVGIRPDQTIHHAAVLMEQAGVGSLAVIEGDDLVGIVTDRDLVRRGLARSLTRDARVDGVMTSPVVTISAEVRSARRVRRPAPGFGEPAMRASRTLPGGDRATVTRRNVTQRGRTPTPVAT